MLLALGLTSQPAHAALTGNDIYLGFSQSSASADYLIDLGQPGTIGVGGSSVVDLSSDFSPSLFNSAFSSFVGVDMGAVGGQSQFPSTYDLYTTTLRSGGAGIPGMAGSDLSGVNHSQSTIANAVSTLTPVAFPTAGNGFIDANKTWQANVSPTFTANSFYGASGVNPSSAFDASGVLYEDLWKATPNNSYSYLGYFTMDMSSSSPDLSFTPSASPVPEPGCIQFFAFGGIAWLAFARKFKRGNK